MGFSRQEYWSGLPFLSPGDLSNPGIKPGSPVLQTDALLSEPLIWFKSYLNGVVVFPTFFNLSLNLAIRSSWSEPQSAPGLLFADCIEHSIFGCKEYNQSDFSVDRLVMSMCRVFSCVVGRWCLLWPVCSLGKTLPCFILYSKAKFACYSRYLLTSYFCIPVPYNEKGSFLGVRCRRSCRSS